MVDLTQLPVIGPWARKIGGTMDLLALPCQTTPELWIKGFFAAAPVMIWSLFKPDLLDVRFSRGRGRHGNHKTPHFQLGRAITAQSLSKLGGVGTAMFLLGELASKIGWYFIVIDAGVDLAYNWTSAVYQYAGCVPPGGQYLRLTAKSDQLYFQGQDLITEWDYDEGDNRWNGVHGIICPAGMNGAISCGMTLTKWSVQPDPVAQPVVRLKSNGKIFARQAIPPPTPGNTTSRVNFMRQIGRSGVDRLIAPVYDNLGGISSYEGSTLTLSDADYNANSILGDP